MSDQTTLKSASPQTAGYNDLKYYFANLNTLFSIRGVLAVDMMTAMPSGALQRRMSDMAALTKRIYAETTSPSVSRLLEQIESDAINNPESYSDWDKANIEEMRRIHSHLSALPPELYIASVQIANEGRKRHAMAQVQTWDEVSSTMQQIIDVYKRVADLKQKKFGSDTAYQALLLGYASDISDSQMDALYDDLLPPLAGIRNHALEKQKSLGEPLPLEGEYSKADQMWLNKTVLDMMGFDFNRGSLQVSALSPMMGGCSDDARVLVRCGKETSFLDSLDDTLYQGASALYLQNLPKDWAVQPVGQDLGTLMMTANSQLFASIIGRTPQFFEFIASRAEGLFHQFKNKSFAPENLYRLRKIVRTTAQRNDADELTKIFHDVMRYRIEKDLLNGSLAVKDLRERWYADSRSYLGLEPKSDMEGPLQNPDWFTGRFGFISTNTLSHIIAASLQQKIFDDVPNLQEKIQKGDLNIITQWMSRNVYQKGKSLQTMELIEGLHGGKLTAKPLIDHFERRYLSDKR